VTFQLLSEIAAIEVIARGGSVRRRAVLRKRFGQGPWRKLKGVATVRLVTGAVHRAEIHWYEAHGVGRVGMKIKRYLD
jgi:hypothetical protein